MTTNNRQRIKDTIKWAEAYANGEKVEFLNTDGKWKDVQWWNFETFSGTTTFRIKPEPRLRPWKPEEVPVGALIRAGGGHPKSICGAGVAGHDSFSADALFIRNGEGYPLSQYVYLSDAVTSASKYEHSTDHGKTWKPCGVEESA